MIKRFFSVFGYTKHALVLVWQTSARFTLVLAMLTVIAGLIPAGIAYFGQLIVDGVIADAEIFAGVASGVSETVNLFGLTFSKTLLWAFIAEAILVIGLMLSLRGMSIVQSLFRGLLGFRVNVMILEKAQTISLSQFENSEFYDKLVRARRQASTRPLGLVNKTFGLLQNGIALMGFAVLLTQFSPFILAMLFLAALPAFFSETYFSEQAFNLFKWRSPEARTQNYLETLLAREDNAKEIKLLGLGEVFLDRYTAIFTKLYGEDKALTLTRDLWGAVMDGLATVIFYAAYLWVVFATIKGQITLGQMTMYLLVFKQGQSAIKASLTAISGMYEDNLYLSNLYEYLDQPGEEVMGGVTQGAVANEGFRLEGVSYQYEGATFYALKNISFSLKPGDSLAIVGENGSGKTTLIKLLTRLYMPTEGIIYYDGTPLNEWDAQALHKKIGVIFQDFIRYQLLAGENIGVGSKQRLGEEAAWRDAAVKGQAADFIEQLPNQYKTQLGRWFKGGQELSGGQWQKIALARAFIRKDARVLILDEPTSAMDAQAEADIFNEFSQINRDKMTILISHRFSTVRKAKNIFVMRNGEIIERGSHAQLIIENGIYAELFNLQAEAYL